MSLLFLLLILGIAGAALAVPLFEFVFGSLLLIPIVAYLFAGIVELNGVAYKIAFFFIWIFTFILVGPRKRRESLLESLPALLTFVIAYSIAYHLCLLWPDFFPNGERLRDYALIALAIKNPYGAPEPWMAGATLNYYLFWYRFASMISALLSAPVWTTYHMMIAFPIALLGATTFQIIWRHLLPNPILAGAGAVLVTFGSNIAGVVSFLTKDNGWWGPSRVIPGAINEFPAWSFLLGDAHPHYLNCATPLFLTLCLLRSRESELSLTLRNVMMLLFIPFFLLFLYNANVWEVPQWLGLAALIVAFLFVFRRKSLTFDAKEFFTFDTLALGAGTLFLVISLYLSSRNISPGEQPLSFVREPVRGSPLFAFLAHWGFPLSLISISTVSLFSDWRLKVFAAVMLLGTLFLYDAAPFLYTLLSLNLLRLITEKAPDEEKKVIFEAILFGSLGLLLLPEIIFVNDAYGGENERMNTIFKVYSFTWPFLYTAAFFIATIAVRRLFGEVKFGQVPLFVCGAVDILFSGFTYRTIELRKNDRSVIATERGLGTIDKRFPGAAAAIAALTDLPAGTVIEAQGNPYDYTTHVATLSGNTAYLGWANHVNLLTRDYGEVKRREDFTTKIYSTGSCQEKRELLLRENIRYVVLGPLEKEKYKATSELFSCIEKTVESESYKIFQVD